MIRMLLASRRIILAILCGGLTVALFLGRQQAPDACAADKFAADREDETPAAVKAVPFEAKRSMEYLKDLCSIGTRISGSEGMSKQREILQKHFEKQGASVEWQKFEGKQPSQKAAVPMANMIVTWNANAKRRVMICGHYDTRPIADQEPRERDWHKPFLSANDGTSTVAFMMELAHHMTNLPTQVGVDFVIFDGEEFINENRDRFFLGSEYFAKQYLKEKPNHQYIAAVLLDLFAGKGATYPKEINSLFRAGEVLESIWQEAERQGVKSFRNEAGPDVQDDHIALNRAGIPAVDIIDFKYRHWHKLTDLPEECSGEKMAEVAKVLTAWVQRLK